MGDFPENYNLTVQDEIQGKQWKKQSCTLHPIVIYITTGGELVSHSLCIVKWGKEEPKIRNLALTPQL